MSQIASSVSKATLDERPMAYKGMEDILENIGPAGSPYQ